MTARVPRRAFLGFTLTAMACGTGDALPPSRRRARPPGDAEPAPPRVYEDALVTGVPHVRQRPDFCGEACVAMVLGKLGIRGDQDDVFDAAGLDPGLGRGCYTPDLKTAMERLGFDPGPVWFTLPEAEPATAAEDALEGCWARVHEELVAGVPAIVCMRYSDAPTTTEHMRLIIGYDEARDEVIYHEPAEDEGAALRMPRSTLLELWPLRDGEGGRFCVHLRAAARDAGSIQVPPPVDGHRPAAYCQRILALNEELDGRGFTVLREEPFVVVGDGAPEDVKRSSKGTIRWAVDHLRAAYFDQDPQALNTIWLFDGERSYNRHAKEFFGERPDTPYGYYSRAHEALVMNIATGGGTLVHELVHPFIESNFPACPSWFDEGLASLYEQCAERRGMIWGLTNWRLEGLQQAIRAGSVPSFQTLCATTSDDFYERDPGTNYAQARYLCYWLQERDLLRRYYRAFRDRHREDPGGYAILSELLGAPDMRTWQAEWERYVLGLRFG